MPIFANNKTSPSAINSNAIKPPANHLARYSYFVIVSPSINGFVLLAVYIAVMYPYTNIPHLICQYALILQAWGRVQDGIKKPADSSADFSLSLFIA